MEILTAMITPTKPDAQDAKRKLISGKLGRFDPNLLKFSQPGVRGSRLPETYFRF